jgi:nucleotide-binding universal stress UspA family protein
MISTILVAIDGSEHAKKALSLAIDLARKYKSRLVLTHVFLSNANSDTLRKLADKRGLTKKQRNLLDNYEVDMLMVMTGGGVAAAGAGFVTIPAPRELVEVIGHQIVDRAEASATKAGVKKITTVLVDGDAADVILECAAKEKAGMIVLGSRGLSDFKGLLLGSVSHKVAARADCACLTVK